MGRRLVSVAAATTLLAGSVLLGRVLASSRTATQKPEPVASQIPEKQEAKSDPVLAKVEAALADEGPGTVIVADKNGKILEKKDVQDLIREGYKSLREFANKKNKSDDCQKVSTKCVRCPDGKIYCSKDAFFAVGDKPKL